MKKKLPQIEFFRNTFLVGLFVTLGVFAIGAITKAAPMPGIYNAQGNLEVSFPDVKPDSSVALGDVDKDGEDEIVIGSAPGDAPEIVVYEKNGKKKMTINPFGDGMIAGLNVATGDLTGYGNIEIIVVPRRGAGSHVLRFDGKTGKQLDPGFFAYTPRFHGGANIATGDVNGDGRDEIITGAGPGSTHVRIYKYDGYLLGNVFPYVESNGQPSPWGAAVGAIDIDNDGRDEIVVGPQEQHVAEIKVFSWKNERLSFNAYGSFTGGVSLSTNDSGGGARVLLGAGFGGGPHVQQFNLQTKQLDGVSTFPFDGSWREGVTVAFVEYTNGVKFFAIPGSLFEPKTIDASGKTVLVDLSEQRLYAYQDGRQVNTFLVSTGLPGMDTRVGHFQVTQKIYSKLYSGPDYYLPNTLYNLRFDGSRLLHGAYWHNDFGRRKSHGCVNIAYPNAEWLYNWAPVGTTVIVQQ